jgi:hypothetical protein
MQKVRGCVGVAKGFRLRSCLLVDLVNDEAFDDMEPKR